MRELRSPDRDMAFRPGWRPRSNRKEEVRGLLTSGPDARDGMINRPEGQIAPSSNRLLFSFAQMDWAGKIFLIASGLSSKCQ
jgi:hypothetical protein